MKQLVLVFCALAVTDAAIWDLLGMAKCTLDRSLFSYNDYGCNCGFNRENKIPVDEVDRCCLRHKACYQTALEDGDCPWYKKYLACYKWKCDNQSKLASCVDDQAVCEAVMCACDTIFFSCLKNATYHTPKPICEE